MMAVYGRGKRAAKKEIMERLSQINGRIYDLVAYRTDKTPVISVIVGNVNSRHIRNCAILLTPGGGGFSARAGCVVSYGMSPRDTLTLSSIGEEECVIAVQRRFPTVWGGTVERQELVVKRNGRTPEQVLVREGALLLLGAYGPEV